MIEVLADAADELAGRVTGHRPGGNWINGLIGWITGDRRKGNSVATAVEVDALD